MYVDFNFYQNTYKGKVVENDFTTLEIKARALVDYYTFNRIDTVTENIKFAVCELVDNIKEYEDMGGKEISAEKVGTYSVTYANDNATNANARKQRRIIHKWLPAELLYRGVYRGRRDDFQTGG